jgi:hypothetical protein
MPDIEILCEVVRPVAFPFGNRKVLAPIALCIIYAGNHGWQMTKAKGWAGGKHTNLSTSAEDFRPPVSPMPEIFWCDQPKD